MARRGGTFAKASQLVIRVVHSGLLRVLVRQRGRIASAALGEDSSILQGSQ